MRDVRRHGGTGYWVRNTSEKGIVPEGRRRLRKKGGEKGGIEELTKEEKGQIDEGGKKGC